MEARIAAADDLAADLAAQDRQVLIEIQGDANRAEARRAAVANVAAR